MKNLEVPKSTLPLKLRFLLEQENIKEFEGYLDKCVDEQLKHQKEKIKIIDKFRKEN